MLKYTKKDNVPFSSCNESEIAQEAADQLNTTPVGRLDEVCAARQLKLGEDAGQEKK